MTNNKNDNMSPGDKYSLLFAWQCSYPPRGVTPLTLLTVLFRAYTCTMVEPIHSLYSYIGLFIGSWIKFIQCVKCIGILISLSIELMYSCRKQIFVEHAMSLAWWWVLSETHHGEYYNSIFIVWDIDYFTNLSVTCSPARQVEPLFSQVT